MTFDLALIVQILTGLGAVIAAIVGVLNNFKGSAVSAKLDSLHVAVKASMPVNDKKDS